MHANLRTSFKLVAFVAAPAILLACSSGGSTGTGTGGSTTTSTHSSTSSGSTTSSGSSSSGSTSSSGTTSSSGSGSSSSGMADGGDAGACEMACITNNAAAYAKFQGYLLADCGCAAGSACNSQCTSSCPSGPASAGCGSCLTTEEMKGSMSSCTSTAGVTCLGDNACSLFVMCEISNCGLGG